MVGIERHGSSHRCWRSTASAMRRAMLTDIYKWFIEGFDTADLKEAKSLLERLSG